MYAIAFLDPNFGDLPAGSGGQVGTLTGFDGTSARIDDSGFDIAHCGGDHIDRDGLWSGVNPTGKGDYTNHEGNYDQSQCFFIRRPHQK